MKVLSSLSERRSESAKQLTTLLNERPQNVKKIKKSFERLLRTLHKDRHHTLAHFRHSLKDESDVVKQNEFNFVINRLTNIADAARHAFNAIKR